MVEIKKFDAKYYFEHNFTLVIKKQGEIVVRGKKSENPELINYLGSNEYQYFLKINRTHRFLKYLAGQVFIGYYLFICFGLLSIMGWTLLGLTRPTTEGWIVLVPTFTITTLASLMGRRMANKARQRITKSLDKKKTKK